MEVSGYQTATAAEMARILGISKVALDKQRCVSPDNGPPFLRMGRRVLYPLSGPSGFSVWMAGRVQGGGLGQ